MWPFRKKTQPRRLELRRTAGALSAWRRFRDAGGLGAAAMAALFLVGVVMLDLWPPHPFPYREGQYVPADIYSRVRFEYPSSQLKEKELRNAQEAAPAVFKLQGTQADDVAEDIRQLPQRLSLAMASATSRPASQPAGPPATQPQGTQPATWPATRPATQPAGLLEDPQLGAFALTPQSTSAWLEMAQPSRQAAFEHQAALFRAQLARAYIVQLKDDEIPQVLKARELIFMDDGIRRAELPAALADEPTKVRKQIAALAANFDPALRPNVQAYLENEFLQQKHALYAYSQAASFDELTRLREDIEKNPPKETVAAGQLLVRGSGSNVAGEKPRVLNQTDLELLRYEHGHFYAYFRGHMPIQYWGGILGRVFILLLMTVLMALYIRRFLPRLMEDLRLGAPTVVLLLGMLAINKVMVSSLVGWNPHWVMLPILMAVMILTIAFETRAAFTLGLLLAIFMLLQLRQDMAMFLIMLVAVSSGVFQLRYIRTRIKLVEVSAVTAAFVFATTWAVEYGTGIPARFVFWDAMLGAVFSLLAGFLVQGLLPVLERIFHVATSMTLLEWCDASKPLLRRLAMEAPGTYNHSLQLGAMCEAAAEAIGANGLLARVGAYYHDIGKINKPEYFVENQAGMPSRHDKLSPSMSLLIITGHVKDGLELAREYGLPPILREFISSHHGTTLVQYFYQAAAEQRKAEADRAPDEVEFRYPGPKPGMKEAAILMLADAAESSVRSMADPTPGRIDNQVHTMITRRLMDGQLDECDLTLREVHLIEASLVKSLTSIYHSRIAYPTPPGQKPSAAELRPKKPLNGNGGPKGEKAAEKTATPAAASASPSAQTPGAETTPSEPTAKAQAKPDPAPAADIDGGTA